MKSLFKIKTIIVLFLFSTIQVISQELHNDDLKKMLLSKGFDAKDLLSQHLKSATLQKQTSANGALLDSLVTYKYTNETRTDSIPKRKYVYKFSPNKNLILFEDHSYDIATNKLIIKLKEVREYDTYDNLIKKDIYSYFSFTHHIVFMFNYDTNNNLISEETTSKTFYSESNVTEHKNKIEYKYNVLDNNLEYFLDYEWDNLTNDWKLTFKREFSYNVTDNNLLYYEDYDWNEMDNNWGGLKGKTEFIYDIYGNKLKELTYNGGILSDERTYKYDTNNNEIFYESFGWWYTNDGLTQKWMGLNKNTRTYNSNNQIISRTEYAWNDTLDIFVETYKYVYNLDSEGNILSSIIYAWDDTTSAFKQDASLKSNAGTWVIDGAGYYYYDPVSLSVETENLKQVNIFPNPITSSNILTIDMAQPFNYSIYSSTGALIKEGFSKQKKETIDVGALSSGVYFLKITEGTKSITKKIVK